MVDESGNGDMVSCGIQVRDRTVVAVVSICCDETENALVSQNDFLSGRSHLETSFSNSGSRLSGSSTEYSSYDIILALQALQQNMVPHRVYCIAKCGTYLNHGGRL